MPLYLKLYPVVLLSLAVLDFVWLGLVTRNFYKAEIGHLMGASPVWWAAAAFYLMFAAGLIYFAVLPGVAADSLIRSVILGAALGVLAYGTYDFTNQATLKDWPVVITVVDIAWGAVVSGAVSAVGYFAAKFFGA